MSKQVICIRLSVHLLFGLLQDIELHILRGFFKIIVILETCSLFNHLGNLSSLFSSCIVIVYLLTCDLRANQVRLLHLGKSVNSVRDSVTSGRRISRSSLFRGCTHITSYIAIGKGRIYACL